ncbi:hypothetical protein EJD97_012425, partial [Solanum chilense]
MNSSERKADADSDTQQNEETNIVSPSTNQRTKLQQHQTQLTQTNNNKRTGFDLSLPTPQQSPVNAADNIVNVGLAVEVDGGMDGGCQEKHTNLQEGVSKGGKGTLVFDHSDHRRDLRASLKRAENQEAGGINAAGNQQYTVNSEHQQQGDKTPVEKQNNRSQGRPSKKKREAIKRRIQREAGLQCDNEQIQREKKSPKQCHDNSDYEVINSEDGFDEDTQSLNEKEGEEEEDETSVQLINAFGSTFQSEFESEIHEVTTQQGLSPRGRKEVRQYNNTVTTSTSANTSRPN